MTSPAVPQMRLFFPFREISQPKNMRICCYSTIYKPALVLTIRVDLKRKPC